MVIENNDFDFVSIYGDGTQKTKGISLFVFNYLDYKLWEKYSNELKGEKTKKEKSEERKDFFKAFGCSDFELDVFKQFYFSRTRRSLEHYFPTANVKDKNTPSIEQINCFGNFAMIGSDANSSGSNWSPKSKLDHYLDSSGKIRQVSVASLKFMIMMRKCEDNQSLQRESGQEWNFEDIKAHQKHMEAILVN